MSRLATLGLTPNGITVLAILLSFAVGMAIALRPTTRWPLLLLPLALLLRMALNALDGMMAREMDMKTVTGAFLNELGDVFSDAALYLPLALVPGISGSLIVIVVLLAALSEMAGVVAAQQGASRRYDGPMGKSDRAFVFGALGLALGLGLEAGSWVTPLLGLISVALVATVFRRARAGAREVAP